MKCNTTRPGARAPWLKRCVTIALAFALLLSVFPAPAARAADPIGWVVDTFWGVNEWMAHGAGSALNRWWESGPMAFWDGLTGGKEQAERDFVSNVQDELGTVVVGKNGYFIPLTGVATSEYGYQNAVFPRFSSVVMRTGASAGAPLALDFVVNPRAGLIFSDAGYLTVYFERMSAAGVSKYTSFYVVVGGVAFSQLDGTVDSLRSARKAIPAGSVVGTNPGNGNFGLQFTLGIPETLTTLSYRAAYFFEPYNYTPGGFTQTIGGDYTRIGNVDFTVAVEQDNDTVVIEDVYIVNETDNSVYNPVTDITSIITDWTYDFSNRSYDLTLDTGDKMTVTYGDEHITIIEGGTTYNVYYVIPDGDGGGGDGPGPTEPTNPTEPGGGGDVGGDSVTVDGDNNSGGIFKWFGNITITIGDIFGNIFGGGGSGSGEEGEEEEDSGGGFFGWLGGWIGKIFSGALGIVTNVIKGILEPIFDGILSLLDMLDEKIGGVVDRLISIFDVIPTVFGGFLDFLGAGLAFLPPEAMIIFDFIIVGIIIMVILAVYRGLRG